MKPAQETASLDGIARIVFGCSRVEVPGIRAGWIITVVQNPSRGKHGSLIDEFPHHPVGTLMKVFVVDGKLERTISPVHGSSDPSPAAKRAVSSVGTHNDFFPKTCTQVRSLTCPKAFSATVFARVPRYFRRLGNKNFATCGILAGQCNGFLATCVLAWPRAIDSFVLPGWKNKKHTTTRRIFAGTRDKHTQPSVSWVIPKMVECGNSSESSCPTVHEAAVSHSYNYNTMGA
jgi:hypothetical protein